MKRVETLPLGIRYRGLRYRLWIQRLPLCVMRQPNFSSSTRGAAKRGCQLLVIHVRPFPVVQNHWIGWIKSCQNICHSENPQSQ
jgi:hypothetical protein